MLNEHCNDFQMERTPLALCSPVPTERREAAGLNESSQFPGVLVEQRGVHVRAGVLIEWYDRGRIAFVHHPLHTHSTENHYLRVAARRYARNNCTSSARTLARTCTGPPALIPDTPLRPRIVLGDGEITSGTSEFAHMLN